MTQTNIDLKTYTFQKAGFMPPTDETLLAEAELRGFGNHYNPYCKLFSNLFYRGGNITFKEGIDPAFKEKAWRYCQAFMGSFAPKHEEKEAICAMLMSELLELPENEAL